MGPVSDGMHQSSGSRLRKLLRDKEKEFTELTQSSFEALECEVWVTTFCPRTPSARATGLGPRDRNPGRVQHSENV